jgi:xanthosine utilization system XapX-like protein
MPSLFRFLVVVGVIAGLGYGAIYALANFTDPNPREITVIIPQSALNKHR